VADQPWHELPPAVADVIRPLLPALADEIIEAVRTIPAYSRPLDGALGASIRAGVREGLGHLVAEIERSGPVARADTYRELGRGEMRAGRTLDALLTAYRLGARVAWRRLSAAGEAAGLEPVTLYLLAESIFAYIDVLSAESAEGHALERTAQAGEAELARRRMVRLLIREPAVEGDALAQAAAEAGWALPRTLAALAVSGRGVRLHLPIDAITETVGGETCVIVPDPLAPGRRAELARALAAADLRAGIGPAGPPATAGLSFRRARAALALGRAAPLTDAHEHAGELLLASDPSLAAELAESRLAPFAGLTGPAQARMRDTLRVWLDEQGRLGPVARRLGVHPQTARYRINRLRELFGPALEDPEERFWLALALRVEPATGVSG
jgi:hypothetical protein